MYASLTSLSAVKVAMGEERMWGRKKAEERGEERDAYRTGYLHMRIAKITKQLQCSV